MVDFVKCRRYNLRRYFTEPGWLKGLELPDMKKNYWRQYSPGTCEQIIAHAEYRASRGKRPSMTLGKHPNPRKLFALAKKTLIEDEKRVKYADERARVRYDADRLPKVWLGSYDGRNRGGLMTIAMTMDSAVSTKIWLG